MSTRRGREERRDGARCVLSRLEKCLRVGFATRHDARRRGLVTKKKGVDGYKVALMIKNDTWFWFYFLPIARSLAHARCDGIDMSRERLGE